MSRTGARTGRARRAGCGRLPPSRPAAVPARELARLAEAYQARFIVPRCSACEKPCCRLDTLVLELDWGRLRALWRLEVHRSSFDAALRRGEGPREIRAQEGFYYAHGKPCPAYDRAGRSCRVYGSPLKPLGCTDFPVYEQDGHLVADLRCEVVDLDELQAFLGKKLGRAAVLRVEPDPEFPFLVSITPLNERNAPR